MNRNRLITVSLVLTGLAGLSLAVLLTSKNKQSRRRNEAAIDDMIEDSFPASDPPSHSIITSSG